MRGRHSDRSLRVLALALTLAAAFVLAAVPPAHADDHEDGAAATPDTWVCAGGSPARTGVALTDPVRGPVEKAWEYKARGEFESEPLVDHGDVVLTEVRGGRRTLVFVSLADGTVLAEKRLRTTEPLHATMGNGIVYVVGDERRLEAYERRGKSVERVWASESLAGKHALSLLAFGRELYVLTANSIERFDRPKSEASWIKLGRFRGELALRGKHIYAVGYDDDGNASIRAFPREGQGTERRAHIGHHDGTVPPADAPMWMRVQAEYVFVRHALPVRTEDGGTARLVRVERAAGGGLLGFGETGLFADGHPAVPYGRDWVGLYDLPKRGRVLARAQPDGSSSILASPEWSPEFLTGSGRPTRAGQVVYLSGRAIDIATDDILWRTPFVGEFPAIPARETVLLPVSARRVVAIRGRGGHPTSAPATLLVPPEGEASVIDRLVTRSRSVVTGPFRLDASSERLTSPHGSVALTEVVVGVDAGRRVICAASGPEVPDGLRALAADEVGTRFADLAVRAAQALDGDLARRLLAAATRSGAPPEWIEAAEEQIRTLDERAKPPEPNVAELERVLADERAAQAGLREVVWRAYETLPDGAPLPLVLDLLRDVLERDPDHARASAAVRALVPEGATMSDGSDARAWLPFIEAAQHAPVTVHQPPARDTPSLSPAERIVGSMAATWRRDVVGVESPQLLVITPLDSPERLARCLSLGDLVCDRLEEFFRAGERRRSSRFPLTVQLFDSESAYRTSLRNGGKPEHISEWSSGHYDAKNAMSRIYLPAGDEEFRRVMSVFAHELTHQWIDERCPLFAASERRDDPRTTPGHWVVEGFAEMVEAMDFDLRARTWRPDARSDLFQIISAIDSTDLLPWQQLVDGTYADFTRLGIDATLTVHSPHRLGSGWVMSGKHLYYAQAGAICQYLYMADDGKHRAALAEYIGARYRGVPPAFASHFGMTPAELGSRLVAYAKSLQGDDL